VRSEEGLGPLSGVEPFYAAASTGWHAHYRDITTGVGACRKAACAAKPGFDLATGLGSPRADRLIYQLAGRKRPVCGPGALRSGAPVRVPYAFKCM
jgi:hypothetical protein